MTEALHWPVRHCSFVASDSCHAEFDTMEGRRLAVSKAAYNPRAAYPRSTRSKYSIRANVKKIGEGPDLPNCRNNCRSRLLHELQQEEDSRWSQKPEKQVLLSAVIRWKEQ